MLLNWILVFGAIFLIAVPMETLSQLTYRRKTMAQVKADFGKIVLKVFTLVLVMAVSTIVWRHMGWYDGRPIHLFSN